MTMLKQCITIYNKHFSQFKYFCKKIKFLLLTNCGLVNGAFKIYVQMCFCWDTNPYTSLGIIKLFKNISWCSGNFYRQVKWENIVSTWSKHKQVCHNLYWKPVFLFSKSKVTTSARRIHRTKLSLLLLQLLLSWKHHSYFLVCCSFVAGSRFVVCRCTFPRSQ